MTQPIQEYSHATTQVSTVAEIYANRFKQLDWILAEVFNVLAATLVSWFAFSLIVYGKQIGKWRKENRLNPTKVDAGVVYTFSIFTTICCLLRLAANQALFNFGYTDRSSLPCEVGAIISLACYGLSITGSYIFLWFRQRSLHRHPSIEELNKRWLKRLSCVTFIWLFLGPLLIFVYVLTITHRRIVHTSQGCILRAVDGKLPPWPYVTTLFTTLGQVNLLFLLL